MWKDEKDILGISCSTYGLSFIKMVSFLSEISLRKAVMSKWEEPIWQSKPTGSQWGKLQLQTPCKVISLRECALFPHVGFALSVTCACESFPCCGFGANLQRVCLARLTASPEYSSMCKTSHNAQLLMLFHTSLPPRSRDLMTNSFNFSYPEARHVRKEGAALWKRFYF